MPARPVAPHASGAASADAPTLILLEITMRMEATPKCRALFASTLQRSEAPGPGVVAEAIRVTVQQLGTDGCTGRMAQEFGDHPEAAAERMRWVRSLLICCSDDHCRHVTANRGWQR